MEEKKSNKLFLSYIGIAWFFALVLIFADGENLTSTFVCAYSLILFIVIPVLVFQKQLTEYLNKNLFNLEKKERNFKLLVGFHILIPFLALVTGNGFFNALIFSGLMFYFINSILFKKNAE